MPLSFEPYNSKKLNGHNFEFATIEQNVIDHFRRAKEYARNYDFHREIMP